MSLSNFAEATTTSSTQLSRKLRDVALQRTLQKDRLPVSNKFESKNIFRPILVATYLQHLLVANLNFTRCGKSATQVKVTPFAEKFD